jgi:predicted Zn-dependent protease
MTSIKISAWGARIAAAIIIAFSFVPIDAYAQAGQGDPTQAARLKRIMVPLLEKMDNPIPLDEVKVSLADDNSINAGNAGGGNFLVTTGLLERANDDQLRAIMAHEVAHADKNHVAHQELLNTGLQIGISLLDQWFPGSSALTPIAGQAFSARYGRGEEHQADAHGVEILKRAGYDGKRMMADTLTWLQKQEGGGGGNRGLAGFFATHPATGDRVQAIRQLP